MTYSRGQSGFTLIELLVAMSILTVVVMATITAFVSFNKAERVNRLQNEAQDEARLTVERLSSQLRNLASPTDNVPEAVEKDEPFDLVFLTVDAVKPVGSLNARNIKRVRYCVGSVVNGKAPLVRQQQTWIVTDPPPSYATSGCPAASWEKTTVVASDVVNTAQPTPVAAFTYSPGPAPLDDISAIRSELMIDWNPGQSPIAVELSSRVFLRNQNRVPTASCTAEWAGNGNLIALNGSGSSDPEGFNLKEFHWYADGNAPPSNLADPDNPDATGIVGIWDAQSSGAHTIMLRVRDQGDLTATVDCGTVVIPS